MQTKIYHDCATDNMCSVFLFPGPLRIFQSKESGFDFHLAADTVNPLTPPWRRHVSMTTRQS